MSIMNRRQFIKLAALPLVQRFAAPYVYSGESPKCMTLFAGGEYHTSIVVSPQANKRVWNSANLMAKYFKQITGVPIAISDNSKDRRSVKIHLGPGEYSDRRKKDLERLDDDGFIIDSHDGEDIVIAGPTDWGTEFGVYEFLERYMGVRWLLPGLNGEHIPTRSLLRVPMEFVRQEPAFFSRYLEGISRVDQEWAVRNKMHGRIKLHHNLLELFPPEKYKESHPEFFPVLNGSRFLPSENKSYDWQPCFSAEGIIEEAIKNICQYFSQNPESNSYSLAMNDSNNFCQCIRCLGKSAGKKNFLRYRDFSNLYYSWANAVAKGVIEKYPTKWFGALAYCELAEPPSELHVHPRIVPYMTYDRMKWVDAGIEKEGKARTKQWKDKVSVIGWYDYIYGTPYCLPRVYFHKMAEYYAYAAQTGVRAMCAEAYPNWGEGPKLYVALKLQWDPFRNVDSLLNDWYECTVGEDAAPYLRAYYNIWEEFWTKNVAGSKWFSRGIQYLHFHNPDYLNLVTDGIYQSRQMLEAVVTNTKTSEQRSRANLLLKAFEYYEASTVSYLGMNKDNHERLKQIVGISKEGWTIGSYVETMRIKRMALIEEFQNDSVLGHSLKPERYKALQW